MEIVQDRVGKSVEQLGLGGAALSEEEALRVLELLACDRGLAQQGPPASRTNEHEGAGVTGTPTDGPGEPRRPSIR